MSLRNLMRMVCMPVVLTTAGLAQAGFVTSQASISAPSKLIDFSQFSGSFAFTTGPVQIGAPISENVTWESNYEFSVIGNGGYGLNDNGSWDSGRIGYVGTNSSSSTVLMTFRFLSGSVAQVGAFVNYAPNTGTGDFFIEALASNGTVLESYNVSTLAAISTPNQFNAGAFRGIVRAQNDIAAFRLSGAFGVADDLRFHRAEAVPEPASLVIWGIGALGMGLIARRRTKKVAAV